MMKHTDWNPRGSHPGLPGMMFRRIGYVPTAVRVKKILRWKRYNLKAPYHDNETLKALFLKNETLKALYQRNKR